MKRGSFPISRVIGILRREIVQYKTPIVSHYADGKSPFKVLVSTLLSLRTKDHTTESACVRLFAKADTPVKILALPVSTIEKLIYPVGFYRVKAANLHSVCGAILEQHGGKVPADMEKLLAFKGVGRKTANLVLTHGFNLPGICVDIHVHRISNRWGYLKTSTPDQSEMELREILPKKHWIEYNDLLVTYGQNLCKPVSPFCSKCKIEKFCRKVGVKNQR